MNDQEEYVPTARELAQAELDRLIQLEQQKDGQVEGAKEIRREAERENDPDTVSSAVMELAQFMQVGEQLKATLGDKFQYILDSSWAVGNLDPDQIRRERRKLAHVQRVESMKGPLNKESLETYIQEQVGKGILLIQLSKSAAGFQQREHHTTRKDISASTSVTEEPQKKTGLLAKVGL